MARLNQQRQKELEPKRMQYAIDCVLNKGYEVTIGVNHIEFKFKGSVVCFYPYTGWATGKTIKDGRGIVNLLAQI